MGKWYFQGIISDDIINRTSGVATKFIVYLAKHSRTVVATVFAYLQYIATVATNYKGTVDSA